MFEKDERSAAVCTKSSRTSLCSIFYYPANKIEASQKCVCTLVGEEEEEQPRGLVHGLERLHKKKKLSRIIKRVGKKEFSSGLMYTRSLGGSGGLFFWAHIYLLLRSLCSSSHKIVGANKGKSYSWSHLPMNKEPFLSKIRWVRTKIFRNDGSNTEENKSFSPSFPLCGLNLAEGTTNLGKSRRLEAMLLQVGKTSVVFYESIF